MSKNVYLIILKGGVLLSLLSVVFVFHDFLFPYISSKQIYFNILIEVLVVFWLAFLIKFPEYRPFGKLKEGQSRKSLITFGLVLYFLAILLSSIFGVDFNLSYWGDIERMLGFFHIFHFLLLYLIIITVFKEWRDWKILFIGSILFACFVSIKGLGGDPNSTIGNTAYVAGYLIFNIYFSLLLFVKEKDWVLKWIYLIPLLVMFPSFYKADSSGGFVGLGFSLLCLLFLYGVLNKNKKIKRTSLILTVLGIIFVVSLFSLVKKEPFSDYTILRPIKEINFEKNTFQTRLISWRAAFKDLPNHPMLGTGFGNYAITFDKYFTADFYTYTRSETYFDRAHNNLIDILSTTGIVGLSTYLIFILAAFGYLIFGYKKDKIDLHNFVIIFCLLIAYLVQNLAVFDSLVTYIALMITLGYIHWLVNSSDQGIVEGKEIHGLLNKEILCFVVFGIISLSVIYQYNVKPIKMLKGTIHGLTLFNSHYIWEGYQAFDEALSYNTPLDRDSRFSFIRSFLSFSNTPAFLSLSKEQKNEIAQYNLDLAHKNLELNPNDNISNLQLSESYQAMAVLNIDNIKLSNDYINEALKYVNKSIELSPERITAFFAKSRILLNLNRDQEAIDLLEYAIELNENYFDTYCNLGQIYIATGNNDRGYELMNQCIDLGGLDVLNNVNTLRSLLSYYSSSTITAILPDNYPRVIKIYKKLSIIDVTSASQSWINIAKLYEIQGEYDEAIIAAWKAAEINPSLKSAVEAYARDLENKINN